jgi:hypothetical protein
MTYTISVEHRSDSPTIYPIPESMTLGQIINLAMKVYGVNADVRTVAIMEEGKMVACYDGSEWR